MGLINVSDVVLSNEFVQVFEVHRSSGSWVGGRWTEDKPTVLKMAGVIYPANAKELNMLPEGDRIRGSITVHSVEPIFITREEGETSGTSDKIKWRGEFYKVSSIQSYADYGYYKAICERIAGN